MNDIKKQVPDLLFHTAQGFYDLGLLSAINVLKEQTISGFQRMAPAAVNMSFAAELLLKGLILSTTNKTLRGHYLKYLFNELPVSIKTQIEVRYNFHQEKDKDDKQLGSFTMDVYKATQVKEPKKVVHDKSLSKLLTTHNKSFENWRYLHEIGKDGYTYEIDFKSLHCFIKALVEIINSLPRKQKFFITQTT